MAQVSHDVGARSLNECTLITVDLIRASYRSDDFPKEWTNDQRRRSLNRYERWLQLKKLNPRQRLAPTRDIDLFWHLHMLAPVAYHRDCLRNFGRILDHDGGFGKGEGEATRLREVFLATAELWEKAYREPYGESGQWVRDLVATDCWHDCQDRCWHACSDDDRQLR